MYLLALAAALLGAALVVMPAIAISETAPTVEAVNYGLYSHYWRPASATVLAGGVVRFSNPYAETNHGLEFTGALKPSCSGIPKAAGEIAGAANWQGECTFAAAGTYTFICTVHPAEMKGTVTVSAGGITTATTTGSTSTAQPPAGGAGQGPPGAGSPGQQAVGASPLAGALTLGAGPHARSVHGSVNVSSTGAGGRLEVDVLATRASLARVDPRALVRVGRMVRPSLTAGAVRFTVALSRSALRSLRTHRHLAVIVRVLLAPLHGTPVMVARRLLLRS
jgi:plastocyanin